MTSVEYGSHAPRVSDAERERALAVLRQGLVDGRVSQDTFVRRMELILAAVRLPELNDAIRDLPYQEPAPQRTGGWFLATVTRLSAFNERMRRAWQSERLPQLLLPAPGPLPLSIGRASGSGLRLNHASVSRQHATLRGTGTGWTLRDLGSSNGTWVNGLRVTDSVRVRPGDHVSFGAMAFRLAAPSQELYR
ncbi:FHA domain-containing protein [Streptomyces sp. 6N223]|uniref:FHA domain-containing protein n=1 Tax=Streptomyces sp. 6N223 TaxID=3457412 RepID=UPI003FD30C0C